MATEAAKVLIVEDSPTMQKLYRLVLGADEATELSFASDGLEGLDLAAKQPEFGLYIVDINMPRMDGFEFIRRLRGELGLTEAPVLVISTEAEQRDRDQALTAGADGYLRKPLDPDELLREVERLRGGHA